MGEVKSAKFAIGQVVRHRVFPFRGVIFDVDPEFNNTEEWYEAIPAEVRPRKDQPFYHLLAENADSQYIAYVSEQNLLDDSDGEPPQHAQPGALLAGLRDGRFEPKGRAHHGSDPASAHGQVTPAYDESTQCDEADDDGAHDVGWHIERRAVRARSILNAESKSG